MTRQRMALATFATVALVVLGAFTVGQGQGQGPPPPPLGLPLAGLSDAERDRFLTGKTAFLQEEDAADGLGPVFTENSCAKCHGGTATTGSAGTRTVTRFGRMRNGLFDPMVDFGGTLIQDRGIGRFNGVNFVGETVPRQATITTKRRTTPLFGLGLVDAVPDQVFLALAQIERNLFPATAGRASMVTDPATGLTRVGKFGWKAQQPSLFAFAGDAYVNEMGITTPLFPTENCPQGNCRILAANPADTQPNDLTNDTLHELADFMAFLAPAPTRRLPPNHPGRGLFMQVGCAQCHTPIFQTGVNPVPALSQVTFAPYSDFLLHDMGNLGDGIVQNTAGQREMRTAPLWGLKFEPSYLHDGRAKTVEDAIMAHDGQGADAKRRFSALRPQDRGALLDFLSSL